MYEEWIRLIKHGVGRKAPVKTTGINVVPGEAGVFFLELNDDEIFKKDPLHMFSYLVC
jgi:hypothetical protein